MLNLQHPESSRPGFDSDGCLKEGMGSSIQGNSNWIPRVLDKKVQDPVHTMILVVPIWQAQPWHFQACK